MSGSRITFGCSLSVEDYWDVPAFARRAEELGFRRDDHGRTRDGRQSAAPHGAEPARHGCRRRAPPAYIRVMTGIVIAPLYHPVLLAKMVVQR